MPPRSSLTPSLFPDDTPEPVPGRRPAARGGRRRKRSKSAKSRYGPGSGRGSLPGERRRPVRRKDRRGSTSSELRAKQFDLMDPEQVAAFVRGALIDRLDQMFENPDGHLKDVLDAVGEAERLAAAVVLSDRDEIDRLSRTILERRRRMTAAKVAGGSLGLLEALSWGLFPEAFAPVFEEEFRLRQDQERARKIEAGERPWGTFPATSHARCGECGRPVRKPDPRPKGLVPRGGGERLGAVRMACLAEEMGIDLSPLLSGESPSARGE